MPNVINNVTGQSPVATPASPPSTDSIKSPGDFQTFLTLLTTQMRNQDPLKPMDSTAFVAQLATFSSVEQQIQTNTHLTDILDASSRNADFGLSAWLGKQVQHSGATLYQGIPKDLGVEAAADADYAELVVQDEHGNEIDRKPISVSDTHVMWDGPPPSYPSTGLYKFQTESFKGGKLISASDVSTYDEVTELRMQKSGAELVLTTGEQISASSIASLRGPSH